MCECAYFILPPCLFHFTTEEHRQPITMRDSKLVVGNPREKSISLGCALLLSIVKKRNIFVCPLPAYYRLSRMVSVLFCDEVTHSRQLTFLSHHPEISHTFTLHHMSCIVGNPFKKDVGNTFERIFHRRALAWLGQSLR